ncbi:MAG TPA: hypothetical protein VHD33_06770 [Legionellaceae bacterium]|nr:hypothetical protein [Legionellaceae bacterium]
MSDEIELIVIGDKVYHSFSGDAQTRKQKGDTAQNTVKWTPFLISAYHDNGDRYQMTQRVVRQKQRLS